MLLPVLLAAAAPTLAAPLPPPSGDPPPPEHGLFLGPEYRYGRMPVLPRALYDLVAVPASASQWSGRDWTAFAAITTTTVALMAPTNPSPDVRFQQWVLDNRTDATHTLLPKITVVPMTIASVSWPAALFGAYAVTGNSHHLELGILTLEALGVMQVYHIGFKVLLGREGSHQEEGQGIIHGPTFRYFPGGTPSGHAGSAFTILSAFASYYDEPALYALEAVVGTWIGAGLVHNNQHFISDVIWGAAMGHFVGTWVVHHRRRNQTPIDVAGAPRRYARSPLRAAWDSATLVPMITDDATGLAVAGVW